MIVTIVGVVFGMACLAGAACWLALVTRKQVRPAPRPKVRDLPRFRDSRKG